MKFDKVYLEAFRYGSNSDQMIAVKHYELTELIPAWERLTETTPSVYHGKTRLCQAHCTDPLLDYLKILPFRRLEKHETVEIRSSVITLDNIYDYAEPTLSSIIDGDLKMLLVEVETELQVKLFGEVAYEQRQDHSKAACVAFWPNLHMRRNQTQLEYYLWLQAFCVWPQPETAEQVPVPERT